jgi:predicted DCC family thiol-disulfide oxidoreductase YuxK
MTPSISKTLKIILFDGVCNFCNASINFILKHDKENIFRFSPQQSEKGKELLVLYGREDCDLNALILIDENELLEGMDATIGISKYLKGYPSLFYLLRFLPRKVTHAAYAFVAKNRYKWFGKREVCRIPEPGEEHKFL